MGEADSLSSKQFDSKDRKMRVEYKMGSETCASGKIFRPRTWVQKTHTYTHAHWLLCELKRRNRTWKMNESEPKGAVTELAAT